MKLLSEEIVKIRKEYKLTQQELADRIYVTRQAVSKWETGKNIPDIQILKQICSDYNIRLDNLLEGNKNSLKETKKIFIIGIIIVILIISSISLLISINVMLTSALKSL